MQPYAPLATIYAAAFLQKENYEVALHDTMFEQEAISINAKLNSFCKNAAAYIVAKGA